MGIRERIREKADTDSFRDEYGIYELGLAGLLSYLWVPTVVALVIVPFHEFGHILGTFIERGALKSVTYLHVENWFSQYFYPLVPNGPLGMVTSVIPEGPLLSIGRTVIFPSGTAFYFTPYVLAFSIGLFLMLGDNTKYLPFIEPISNKWRLIGAPMVYHNFVAFWNDLALYQGVDVSYPWPVVVFQILYVSIVLFGFVGYTMLQTIREIRHKNEGNYTLR